MAAPASASDVVGAQIPKQRLTLAAFHQWGNIATSDNGTLALSWSGGRRHAGRPAVDVDDGRRHRSYDVTWPTRANGDVTTSAGPALSRRPTIRVPQGFSTPVEIDVDLPAANSQVIDRPADDPGGDRPTSSRSDQNLVIEGRSRSPTSRRPRRGGAIVIQVTGVTISGDTVGRRSPWLLPYAEHVADPRCQHPGQLDRGRPDQQLNRQPGPAVGQPDHGHRHPKTGAFAPVAATCSNCASFSSTDVDGRNQLMVASRLHPSGAPPARRGRSPRGSARDSLRDAAAARLWPPPRRLIAIPARGGWVRRASGSAADPFERRRQRVVARATDGGAGAKGRSRSGSRRSSRCWKGSRGR